MGELALYDEIADLLASAAPEQILAFRPSASTQERFEELVYQKKEGHITPREADELNHFLMLEHIFRLAKARIATHKKA